MRLTRFGRQGARFGAETALSGGSFIVDGSGTVVGFDLAMETLTGWPAAEIVGQRSVPLIDGTLAPPGREPARAELTLRHRDGGSVRVEALVQSMDGRGTRIMIGILRVLDRSSKARRLDHGGIDPLTGLLDRPTFRRRLAEALDAADRSGEPLAVILADIDHFRHVNDRLGREKGDQLLVKLAGILRVSVGDEERIARLEDDLFAVLLPASGRGEARQIAAGLRSTVERFRFFRDGIESPGITMSLGAASFPADADNTEDLIARAHEALDEARALGRNRVWCYMRRPRVEVEVPVFFDADDDLLVGYTRDLSPSGVFVQTSSPMDIGMKCALAFPLPGKPEKVHVIGRVVRAVPPAPQHEEVRIPGMGVEFERFGGPQDRAAIEGWLHTNDMRQRRSEDGTLFSA